MAAPDRIIDYPTEPIILETFKKNILLQPPAVLVGFWMSKQENSPEIDFQDTSDHIVETSTNQLGKVAVHAQDTYILLGILGYFQGFRDTYILFRNL